MFAVIMLIWIGMKLDAPNWYYWLSGIMAFVKLCSGFAKFYELGKTNK